MTTAMAQPFDKDHIYEYIKTFNFPRLAGTEGEKKAVNLTKETFKNIGFEKNQIIEQHFKFSNFYSEILIKIYILMHLIFVITIFLIKYIYTFLTIAIIGTFILIFLLMMKLLRYPELNKFWLKLFGRFYQATEKPLYKSKPSKIMIITSSLIMIAVMILIFTPFGIIMGFTMLSFPFILILMSIVLIYILTNEVSKKLFYKVI